MNSHLGALLLAWWTDKPTSWLVSFLESRGILHWTRRFIAIGGAALAGVEALALLSAAGPQLPVTQLSAMLMIALGTSWALRWLLGPWPSYRESLALAAAANLAITVSCWLDAAPLAGLTGTAAFLMPGSYLTFFHGAKAQAMHVCWALLSILSLSVRVGLDDPPVGGWALAAAKALLLATAIVAILPALQLGFWLVHRNAADALIDPLTGLANRRGLDHRVSHLAGTERGQAPVCVFAIDLDRFKTINDLYGHPVGDNVIIQSAGCIRDVMGSEPVIARVGGEEFIAVALLELSSAQRLADQIRNVIANATNPPVTASVGVAVTTTSKLPSPHEIGFIIECADAAMYCAKRGGGNTVCVRSCADYAEALKARKADGGATPTTSVTPRALRPGYPYGVGGLKRPS